MIALAQAAILAASPHNTQPWLFRIQGDSVDIFADTARNTGGLDPYLRELHIGIGCALENMMVTAPTAGFSATIEALDRDLRSRDEQAGPSRVATVRCVSASLPQHPLYSALPHRHTNRTPYEMRSLPIAFQNTLLRMPESLPATRLFLFSDQAQRDQIVALVSQCDSIVYQDKSVDAGTVPWERVFHWKDVEKYRDGITLTDYGATPLAASVMYCLPDGLEMKVIARTAKVGYASLLNASPLFGVIAVRNRYSLSHCLQAGQLWERAHLLATANGIAARPMNEAVELIDIENSEGRPRATEPKLAAIIADNDWQSTFMFRMGYASAAASASPRRGISQVLLIG
jgi:hypothetical protein